MQRRCVPNVVAWAAVGLLLAIGLVTADIGDGKEEIAWRRSLAANIPTNGGATNPMSVAKDLSTIKSGAETLNRAVARIQRKNAELASLIAQYKLSAESELDLLKQKENGYQDKVTKEWIANSILSQIAKHTSASAEVALNEKKQTTGMEELFTKMISQQNEWRHKDREAKLKERERRVQELEQEQRQKREELEEKLRELESKTASISEAEHYYGGLERPARRRRHHKKRSEEGESKPTARVGVDGNKVVVGSNAPKSFSVPVTSLSEQPQPIKQAQVVASGYPMVVRVQGGATLPPGYGYRQVPVAPQVQQFQTPQQVMGQPPQQQPQQAAARVQMTHYQSGDYSGGVRGVFSNPAYSAAAQSAPNPGQQHYSGAHAPNGGSIVYFQSGSPTMQGPQQVGYAPRSTGAAAEARSALGMVNNLLGRLKTAGKGAEQLMGEMALLQENESVGRHVAQRKILVEGTDRPHFGDGNDNEDDGLEAEFEKEFSKKYGKETHHRAALRGGAKENTHYQHRKIYGHGKRRHHAVQEHHAPDNISLDELPGKAGRKAHSASPNRRHAHGHHSQPMESLAEDMKEEKSLDKEVKALDEIQQEYKNVRFTGDMDTQDNDHSDDVSFNKEASAEVDAEMRDDEVAEDQEMDKQEDEEKLESDEKSASDLAYKAEEKTEELQEQHDSQELYIGPDGKPSHDLDVNIDKRFGN